MMRSVRAGAYRRCMTVVKAPSREDLEERRAAILEDVGLSESELQDKADHGGLVGEEWSAWAGVRDVDFLLNDDD
jgi:hypothetical protein